MRRLRFTSSGAPLRVLEGGRQPTLFTGDPTKYDPVYPHVWHRCLPGCIGCAFCNGGLGLCTVCGAGEAELLTECPGYRLNGEARVATMLGEVADLPVWRVMYRGGLRRVNGKWVSRPRQRRIL